MDASLLSQLLGAYVTVATFWSLVGFIVGYSLGRLHHRWIRKKEDRDG